MCPVDRGPHGHNVLRRPPYPFPGSIGTRQRTGKPTLCRSSCASRCATFAAASPGFGIFLACIALGVAAITGVGSVSRSLSDGLARQGRTILGGDASFDLIQREAIAVGGGLPVRGAAKCRASACCARWRRGRRSRSSNDDGAPHGTALVELKAVGADYPSTGTVVLDPPMPLADALAEAKDGTFGDRRRRRPKGSARAEDRQTLHIGNQTYTLRAVLVQEPDKLAAGIGFGPRVLMSDAGLAASGLIQPGSLVRRLYRVALPDQGQGKPASADAVHALVDGRGQAFPRSRLGGSHARERVAAVFPRPAPLHPVPDARRPDRADHRRRRRRQRDPRLRRAQAPVDRHDEVARRDRHLRVRPDADRGDADRIARHRDRPRRRHRDALRGRRRLRRRSAGAARARDLPDAGAGRRASTAAGRRWPSRSGRSGGRTTFRSRPCSAIRSSPTGAACAGVTS